MVPQLTSAQVREVDRLASERYHVPVSWLMEAAGWQVARYCRGRTYVVCGKGNNGGDGLAAARHLQRWSLLAGVACINPDGFRGPAAEQVQALMALGVRLSPEPDPEGADLVLDALLGTGISRPAEGRVAEWIELVNGWGRRVISVDMPSGLDADTGRAGGPCMTASVTVTLGLPKPGLLIGDGPARSGQVWVADIGVPFEAYAELGIEVPRNLFALHDNFELGGSGHAGSAG